MSGGQLLPLLLQGPHVLLLGELGAGVRHVQLHLHLRHLRVVPAYGTRFTQADDVAARVWGRCALGAAHGMRSCVGARPSLGKLGLLEAGLARSTRSSCSRCALAARS